MSALGRNPGNKIDVVIPGEKDVTPVVRVGDEWHSIREEK